MRPLRPPYSLAALQARWQTCGATTPLALHADAQSDAIASSLQAEAVTHGRDVYFRSGAFAPATRHGAFLLSHEAAHARQGGGDGVWRRRKAGQTKVAARRPGMDPRAESLNRYYWERYGLEATQPFGELHPYADMEAFADMVYDLQAAMAAKGCDQAVLGERIEADGVLGPKTFAILSAVTLQPGRFPEAVEAFESAGVLLQNLENLGTETREAWQHSVSFAWAELLKAETLGRWRQELSGDAVFDYFIAHGDPTLFVEGVPPEVWESLELPDGSLPEMSGRDLGPIFKQLYAGTSLTCEVDYVKADRPFLHRLDADRLARRKPPKGASLFLYALIPDQAGYRELLDEMGLRVPDKTALLALHAAMLGEETPPVTAGILGAVFLAYLPAREVAEFQRAIVRSLYEQKLRETALEELSADWAESFQNTVTERLAGPADITQGEVLIALLAETGGAPSDSKQTGALLQKASETLGLTVRIGEDAEPVFLPYNAIMKAREHAQRNASRPLRFGLFPDPHRLSGIDSAGFTAKPGPEGGATVGLNVYELTCDSDQGEDCRVHQDWKYFKQYQYAALEPVRIDISELNPNTTFWVQRWRDLAGTDQWRQQSFWVLGSSLPEVSRQLWDLASTQNTVAWIDAVISILAAAAVVAGPLLALEGALAEGLVIAGSSEAVALLTRELIVSAFWFVVSEVLIQKMLDFDAKINDPANGYSDADKNAWGAFKLAMLVLGGSLLLRSAWKGLRARMSAGLQAELGVMEAEMMKAEARGSVSTGKAVGVKAAEEAIAKESDELVEAAMESEGRGGRSLFGKKAPAPTGPLSPELKALYMEQMSSRWLKFKLTLYARLKGVPLDWDKLLEMVESAEFREYASWRQAWASGGYAGLEGEGLVFGMAKPLRKIPILSGSSMQHEIVHAFQELAEGLLKKEAAGELSYFRVLQAEVEANAFGSPALILTFTGGLIAVVTGTVILIYKAP